MRIIGSFVLALICFVASVHAADAPATAPASQPAEKQKTPIFLKASDKEGLTANIGKDVVLEGVIDKAAWSSTGKVMQATFKDAGHPRLQVAVFSAKKAAFDEAFNGDLVKTLRGAKVRVKGTLKEFKGAPEIVLDQVHELTIMEE